jgi:hypothetical protein
MKLHSADVFGRPDGQELEEHRAQSHFPAVDRLLLAAPSAGSCRFFFPFHFYLSVCPFLAFLIDAWESLS